MNSTTHLDCDVADCGSRLDFDGFLMVHEVKPLAAEQGWTVSAFGQDLCPTHGRATMQEYPGPRKEHHAAVQKG